MMFFTSLLCFEISKLLLLFGLLRTSPDDYFLEIIETAPGSSIDPFDGVLDKNARDRLR